MKLLKFKDAAYYAFTGSSFSPEVRRDQTLKEHEALLDADLLKLKELQAGEDGMAAYQLKFEQLFSNWLRAKAQCLSTMIAGPSNFPVRRAERANNRESAKYDQFNQWRESVFKGYERRLKKEAIAEAGGELQVARMKLCDLELYQSFMKEVNKAYPAFKKGGIEGLAKCKLTKMQEDIIIKWVPRYSFEARPFQGFELTNNNAKIKNTAARIKVLEAKEHKADTIGNKEISFEGGRVVLNYIDDRIQIFNDQKPAREIIDSYKKHGMKWSPYNGCWQRKITSDALYVVGKRLLKIEL